MEEIRSNDYNLNIPRYVNTFEEEEIDLAEVMKLLEQDKKEIANCVAVKGSGCRVRYTMEFKTENTYIKDVCEVINIYNDVYAQEMGVEYLYREMLEGRLASVDIIKLSKFRVFLDQCLLLFNKEKMEKDYFKRNLDYSKYLEELYENNPIKATYEYLPELIPILEKKTFFRELTGEVSKIYSNLNFIRNSFAHMQYGNFVSTEAGEIIYYGVYNKDEGKSKAGLVLELVFHQFLQAFFSNHMKLGVAYKHTWLKPIKNTGAFKFYTVRSKNDKYDAKDVHVMNNPVFSENSLARCKFIVENREKFKTDKKIIKKGEVDQYNVYLNHELDRAVGLEEITYFIKFLFDFETEFSNFIIHIIQLNDCVINEKLGKITSKHAKTVIEELKEDEVSWHPFKMMFSILKSINFINRMEDDDLKKINLKNFDVKEFHYKNACLCDFVNAQVNENKISNEEAQYGEAQYVLTVFRNAIAHGNVHFQFDNGEVVVMFVDIYKDRKRKRATKIEIGNLKKFLDSIEGCLQETIKLI